VRVRANPNAQLFVRIFDDADGELPSQDFDLLPETLRVMRRLGATMRPDMRALWEPAVVSARQMLTPDELRHCIAFLTRALEMVSAGADASTEDEAQSAEQGTVDASVEGSRSNDRRR
jgi:hypothetical protein